MFGRASTLLTSIQGKFKVYSFIYILDWQAVVLQVLFPV